MENKILQAKTVTKKNSLSVWGSSGSWALLSQTSASPTALWIDLLQNIHAEKKGSDAAINSSWSGDNITVSHSPVRKVSRSMIVKRHF